MGGSRTPVVLIDHRKDKVKAFKSILSCAKYLNISQYTLDAYFRRDQREIRELSERGLSVMLASEYYEFEGKKTREPNIYPNARKGKKRVNQLNPTTCQVMRTFNSIKEAGEFVGTHHTNISKACRGKLVNVAGFRWEYNFEGGGK